MVELPGGLKTRVDTFRISRYSTKSSFSVNAALLRVFELGIVQGREL